MNILMPQNGPTELDELVQSFESMVFKATTEPTRAQIVKFLMLNGRFDISSIAAHLPQDRSVTSRHLKMMADAGILIAAKETRHIYYSINCRVFLSEFEKSRKLSGIALLTAVHLCESIFGDIYVPPKGTSRRHDCRTYQDIR